MTLYTLSDLARVLEVSRGTLSARRRRGLLVAPDHATAQGWPLWSEQRLRQAGILRADEVR